MRNSKAKKLLKKINEQKTYYRAMSDEKLQAQTEILREKIANNEDEEAIIVEAFAVVREASYRVLKMFHTDEQVLGGLVLYEGYIAEMKTGEGKSLVATLPLYLKALTMGRSFLITTNGYLAKRDKERIGPVYEWLGLSVSDSSAVENETKSLAEQRKIVYGGDIIYTSNGEFGFDFLIDGLADSPENRFMPELTFALLDEVDEILIDTAQTPLIISGNPKVQSNYFDVSHRFVQTLRIKQDYEMDDEGENVWLTEKGIEKAKHYFSVDNLLGLPYFSLYQHVILALKAEHTIRKDKDYLVEDGEVKLLSRKDGRILEGSSLQSGLHQAVQTKEGAKGTPESQTISSVTYQNLFRQFRQLSGMSGTAKVAEPEFIETYNLPVKKIKTHKKNKRKDYSSLSYVTNEAKLKAALKKIQELHKKEQPLLIITGSVDASELMSLYLLDLGIAHNVLNAKSSLKEAQMIKEAGRVGAVTVSTTMAGRGTDIKITEESIKKGGLAVIITERLPNRRGELQAKGRAGRQGEPGVTYSYESLEDDVIKKFMQGRVQKYYDKRVEKSQNLPYHQVPPKIRRGSLRRTFKKAQQKSEEQGEGQRSQSLQFDNILKLQKDMFNESRQRVLQFSDIDEVLNFLSQQLSLTLKEYFEQKGSETEVELQRFVLDNIDYNFKEIQAFQYLKNQAGKDNFIQSVFEKNLQNKQAQLHDDKAFFQYLQISILKAIDTIWSSQIEILNQLKFVVPSRATAQKTPLIEYEKEAQRSYDYHKEQLSKMIIRNVALSLFEIKKGELVVIFP